MYEKVCEIVLNYVDEPVGGIKPGTKFVEDLQMSSLDIMTMIGDVEDEFDVEIETKDLTAIYTIQEFIDYLAKKV